MTPAQISELEKLDAAIAAAPNDEKLLPERALLWGKTSATMDRVAEDWCRILELRIPAGERNAPELMREGRQFWDRVSHLNYDVELWAQAIAYFSLAIEVAPDDTTCLIARGRAWAHFWKTERAIADFDKARAIGKQEIVVWAEQARAFEHADIQQAANAFVQVLLLENAAGRCVINQQTCLRRAQASGSRPQYQQLAWLDIAVGAAPDDWDILLRRARWWQGVEGGRECALLDLERAVTLWPSEAECWEARAEQLMHDEGYLVDDNRAFLDFAYAIRLRVAAGKIAGDAFSLKQRGDALKAEYQFSSKARAHACYTVAIEREPENASLYLARAQTIDLSDQFGQQPASHRKLSFEDYACVLALDGSVSTARVALIEYLAQTLKRTTAHEQIEALLEARRGMLDFGVAPDLVAQIIGEVERTLS